LGETSGTKQPEGVRPEPIVPRLSVHLCHRIGALDIDVDFNLTGPWTILFGPSGSGKTTILRAIAGLLRPDSARMVSDVWPVERAETNFTLIDTGKDFSLPPHRRNIPLAPQKPVLFPHLTVLQNLLYGYPGGGSAGKEAYRDSLLTDLPRLFRIDDLLRKRPGELSGGEAQRVSMARTAMARQSRVLLLDEPFTGLDIAMRDLLIGDLLAWHGKHRVPILSVTHDVAEAFQLRAEVIKLADGRVVAQGPVEVVLAEERRRLLAQLGGPPSQN
jgi:molybdate transport system ATP-binding protein